MVIGKRLGRYRILEEVGGGSQGTVYRARDERLERDVALKVLPPGTLADDEARRRFRKEALMLSKLNHPNIETVHDFDTEEGIDFLVIEYVPGVTLDGKLAAGALPEREVARLGIQLAQGLAAAHEKGVVHRDLKPGNLRLTPEGQLKLLDFGLARWRGPGPEAAVQGSGIAATTETMSLAGAVVGTLPYMSPEQLRGERVDARSDVYAAGAVLFEMATGRRAFPESGPPLIDAIFNHPPPAPGSLGGRISPQLENIILKALEKDPERRYQSARELRVDLERLAVPASLLPSARPKMQRRGWAVAIPAGLAVALALFLGLNVGHWRDRFFGHSGAGHIRALAVLPLENLSRDPEQEYFADGMTEELITDLAKIGALKVISRTSVMRYKGAKKPLPEIARELGVDAVVEGSVQRYGERVKITVQLIEAASDRHLWAESYERDARDVLALQSEVARAIVGEIAVKLTPGEQARLASVRRVDPEAHEAYLRGLSYFDRETCDDFKKAVTSFEHAIAIDPGYAPAWAGLAQSYFWASSIWLPPGEAMPKARVAAEKALELDPALASAHVAKAYVAAFYDWKWRAAEVDFERAITLEPGNAAAHQMYGLYLMIMARFDESMAELRRARELDPLSVFIQTVELFPLNVRHHHDEAIAAARKVLEDHPGEWHALMILGQAYLMRGRYVEAIDVLHQACGPDSASGPLPMAYLGVAYAKSGDRGAAEKLLQRLLARSDLVYHPYCVGIVYAALGDASLACEWFAKAVEQRSEETLNLNWDPLLDGLRSDPRFVALLERVGLPAR